MNDKEIATIILENVKFEDFRRDPSSPFEGILLRIQWNDRERVKEVIKTALTEFVYD